jgi:dipeptidyl aminopeptidase/acylaminoacyl peptidase
MLVLSLVVLFVPVSGDVLLAQEDTRVTRANYQLAARFTPARMRKLVKSTSVNPGWLEHSERFWYSYETPEGKFFYIVDPAQKSKEPLFDNVKMAADLTRLTKDPYDHKHLPIETIKFVKEDKSIQFEVESSQDDDEATGTEEEEQEEGQEQRSGGKKKKMLYFEYNLETGILTLLEDFEKPPKTPEWASISPDENWIVFGRNHNLFMMDKENYEKYLKEKKELEKSEKKEDREKEPEVVEHQLTTDGETQYSYSSLRRGRTDKQREKDKDKRQPVRIVWSKDSKKFALVRSDRRKVEDLWVINSVAMPRPTLETYRYDMPGEKEVTQYEIHILDIDSRNKVEAKVAGFQDQSISILQARARPRFDPDKPQASLWLSDDTGQLFFSRMSRDMHRVDICVADTTTGEARILVEERLNTYIDTQRLELLNKGTEIIHWSERDGWGHYYLYDTQGNLKNQITSGPFSCRRIMGIDEDKRALYFVANGREEGEDPYYEHLYKVNLDGSGMTLLSPGNFNHSIRMHEDRGYFVDTFSRVDTVPKSTVHDPDGGLLLELEEADFSVLMDRGYKFPEFFKVKAADGVTDLFGVMYKPFDFDASKMYPIIAYVYPGPQTESVSKSFSTGRDNSSLAQLGFIVISVGNRGGHPNRSKWYHNYGYGNLRDYGLADKKATIEQLAARHDFIDIDRVGIYGHSGGGFMSTAAMLVYPDFFKVAVSSSGNHENNVYNKRWSEKHHGVKEVTGKDGKVTFQYSIEKNSELADNLKGRLLLTTGDIDNNVHPANTYRMAEALIKAHKRFDFFIFPGQRHGYGNMGDYWFWVKADYFSEHLLGAAPKSVDMIELRKETEMTGSKNRRR